MSTEKEYKIIVKIKNNVLLSLMRDRGIKSINELARLVDRSPNQVGDIANLKIAGINRFGEPYEIVNVLSAFFGVLPEELFPRANFLYPLLASKIEKELTLDEIDRLAESDRSDPSFLFDEKEKAEVVEGTLKFLTSREREVIRRLYGIGREEQNLEDVGRFFNVSRERVRQIEFKALQRLRHPRIKNIITDSLLLPKKKTNASTQQEEQSI